MSKSTGFTVFAIVFAVVFLGSLALVTNGKFDLVYTISFTPIIFFSELIAFAMVYASIFYDGHEEESALEAESKAHANPH